MSELRNLDASPEVDAREGMGVDQLVRSRLQYLAAQDRSLIAQVQFADAKAAALITLLALLLIEAWRPAATPAAHQAVVVFETFFALAATIGLGASLWSIIPRYPTEDDRRAAAERELYSWPALAADPSGGKAYGAFMRESQHSHLVASIAQSNHALALILARKFQFLRIAYLAGAAALALALLREVAERQG